VNWEDDTLFDEYDYQDWRYDQEVEGHLEARHEAEEAAERARQDAEVKQKSDPMWGMF
jgi:hypothetical protein